ncbi:MAG: hypothetical protein IIA73_08715 [Proteobacteria bacterium]|nr:hypothetical protein [Pseudomonadota bacterium]
MSETNETDEKKPLRLSQPGRLELRKLVETGEVRHTIDVPEAVATVVNVRDDAVYVLGSDGRVFCARIDPVPYLRRQQVIAVHARRNRPPPQKSTWIHRQAEFGPVATRQAAACPPS